MARANIAQRLTVTGRSTGIEREVAVSTVDVDGTTYLVSARGESQWVKNIRHNPQVVLRTRGHSRRYTATEIPIGERAPILAAKFGDRRRRRFATTSADPTQHPVFLLTPDA